MAFAQSMRASTQARLTSSGSRAAVRVVAVARSSAAAAVAASSPSASSSPARRSSKASIAAAAAPVTTSAPVKASAAESEYAMETLTTFLLREQANGSLDPELAVVLSSVATACKQIASLVNRSGISNLTGLAGAANIQGEDQKKLDVVSNEVFCNALRASGRTGVIASEEEDLPVAVEETYSGNYVVVFDPLDGSSNIDAGISTGSIFGVYAPSEECSLEDMDDPEKMMQNCVVNVCQPGNSLLAAGYCLYSSSVNFVITVGRGVWGFTYDSLVGEFVLTHPNMKVPDAGKIYSVNEGNYQRWSPEVKAYFDSLKNTSDGGPYSARYIGSLVGDFHRTLLYGGLYAYPGDSKNPNGKLRLLYECAPMSFIMEQAGGKGSTGDARVLDVMPDKVHQRVPLYVGSPKEIDIVEKFLKK